MESDGAAAEESTLVLHIILSIQHQAFCKT